MQGKTHLLCLRFAQRAAKPLATALALSVTLIAAGCGTTQGDRAVSGGMIGAAGGALIGAATGNPATGAAIGAVGGAAVGAMTDPCDLDLGTPYWRRHGGRAEYDRRCHRHHRRHYRDRYPDDRD